MNIDFWRGKKVLLAPAQGDLAAWILLLLHELKADVTMLAEFQGDPTFFDLINGGSKGHLNSGDFLDLRFWQNGFEQGRPDIVLFVPDIENSPADLNASAFLLQQTQLQTNLLECFCKSTASALVWLSSDRVYKKIESDAALTEACPLAPEGWAASGRLLGEVLVQSYRQEFFRPDRYNKHKKAASILRTSSGFGATLKEKNLLHDCAKSLNAGTLLEIKKPNSVRPWIHFLDQALAVLLAAENLIHKGPKASLIFNIGAEEFESVEEVAREFSETWGGPLQMKSSEKKDGFSLHRKMSSALALQALGWSVKLSLSQGLGSTANWYKKHLQGDESLAEVQSLLARFLALRV